jgi:hypothetical protein
VHLGLCARTMSGLIMDSGPLSMFAKRLHDD